MAGQHTRYVHAPLRSTLPLRPGEDAAASREAAALYLAARNARGVGSRALLALVVEFGGIAELLGAPRRQMERLPRELREVARVVIAAANAGKSEARAVIARCGVERGDLPGGGAATILPLSWEDAAYPGALHDDPQGSEPLLFAQGELPPQLTAASSHEVFACALVGTRSATPQALGFARDLGRAAAREGIVVVSGLALGIDGAAHEGALEARESPHAPAARPRYRPAAGAPSLHQAAVTVAVLGGGHAKLHPRTHAALASRIVASGGALLSLWPPDTPPRKHFFLRRNRVISGLARVICVIQAGERSGTHNTVSHALEQGRTVMVTPAAPWEASVSGTLRYLRDGAGALISEDDLIQQFGELVLRPAESGAQATLFPGTTAESPGARIAAHLDAHGEAPLDELMRAANLTAGATLALLARLELKGAVARTPGGRYRRRV